MVTVMLIHGIPGSSADWAMVSARLAGEFRVVAPDLVGFGARAGATGDLWADAQARVLVDEIPEDDDVVLVGHDFGGLVALDLLARLGNRARGLVIASTNLFPDTPVPFPLTLVRVPGMPRLLFSWPSLRMMLRGHPAPAAAIGPRQQQTAIRSIFTTALRELPQRYGGYEAQLAAIGVPVRVIWGERDPFFPSEQGERTARAAGAPLTIAAGAGHFLPHEAPDAFVEAIRAL
jgi:pimeloyl-ACP methyl ester carboxylesterase